MPLVFHLRLHWYSRIRFCDYNHASALMHEIRRLLRNARLYLGITYGNKLVQYRRRKLKCKNWIIHANWRICNFDKCSKYARWKFPGENFNEQLRRDWSLNFLIAENKKHCGVHSLHEAIRRQIACLRNIQNSTSCSSFHFWVHMDPTSFFNRNTLPRAIRRTTRRLSARWFSALSHAWICEKQRGVKSTNESWRYSGLSNIQTILSMGIRLSTDINQRTALHNHDLEVASRCFPEYTMRYNPSRTVSVIYISDR